MSSDVTRRNFIRFKNQILGGTVLRDTEIYARILGDVDFQFWRYIDETAPYLRSSADIRLDDVTKGKVILERLEKEPSPKRFAELLKAVYEAFSFYFATPKNYGDNTWQTYVNRLHAESHAADFNDLKIKWIEEPEVAFTEPPISERYYLPGEIEITYTGEDWGTEESEKILENGFTSEILQRAIEASKSTPPLKRSKSWYEEPLGKVALGVIVTVIGGGILFALGWI